MNDEVFENRKVAVKLVGRLAKHNPAYVMPSLRKALLQMMTELQFATTMYVSFSEGPCKLYANYAFEATRARNAANC